MWMKVCVGNYVNSLPVVVVVCGLNCILTLARDGAVGWGTALKAGRSRFRFPMGSLEFCIGIILPAALWPWRHSASNRNEYREYFLGGKGGLCVGLATVPLPYAYSRECHEIWEPQLPCGLRACPDRYRKQKRTVFRHSFYCSLGARCGVVVKALSYKPAGRGFNSRWCHWNFSVTLFFRSHYGPGVDSTSNRKEYKVYFLGVKAAGA